MLHTITKRLQICIDIDIEISEVDHYTGIFTSRIFRLALEITFLINKYFFLQVAYELPPQRRKKMGVGNLFEKKKNNKGGTLNRGSRIPTNSLQTI